MSINRNRSKLNKSPNGRLYHVVWINELYPLYWDEGVNFYPKYRRGFKNSGKRLEKYQVRKYRTWKYNRKTQYKVF